MNADKMFEELGYKKYEHNIEPCGNNEWITQDEPYIEYTQENETAKETITFKTYGKNVWFGGYRKDLKHIVPCPISMQELKAINKKVEELGWI